jgi:hypothetical protein
VTALLEDLTFVARRLEVGSVLTRIKFEVYAHVNKNKSMSKAKAQRTLSWIGLTPKMSYSGHCSTKHQLKDALPTSSNKANLSRTTVQTLHSRADLGLLA